MSLHEPAMRAALREAGILPQARSKDLKACRDKFGHHTVEHALVQACQLATNRAPTRVGVYRCPACRGYHCSHVYDGGATVACAWVPR